MIDFQQACLANGGNRSTDARPFDGNSSENIGGMEVATTIMEGRLPVFLFDTQFCHSGFQGRWFHVEDLRRASHTPNPAIGLL
jgi:hypothetical protein